jgi:predicted DNA-binding protein (UPF0251 family)
MGAGAPQVQGRCFEPCRISDDSRRVILSHEELEALRLVDLLDLTQEEAAGQSGISRRTLWKDLHEARKKVADALVKGKIIEIEGCPGRATDRSGRTKCRSGQRCGQASPDGRADSLPE